MPWPWFLCIGFFVLGVIFLMIGGRTASLIDNPESPKEPKPADPSVIETWEDYYQRWGWDGPYWHGPTPEEQLPPVLPPEPGDEKSYFRWGVWLMAAAVVCFVGGFFIA